MERLTRAAVNKIGYYSSECLPTGGAEAALLEQFIDIVKEAEPKMTIE